MISIIAQAAAAAATVTGPIPINGPLDWFPSNVYPASARANREQGRVVTELEVNKKGRPIACLILEGSGHATLDNATCQLLLRNARFKPAKDEQGRPVAGKFKPVPMNWRL